MPAAIADPPKPSAPAPSPAAPAAPAPAPAPSTPPPRAPLPPENYKPTSQSADPFADLESLETPDTPPAPTPAPKADDKGESKPTGETGADHPIDPKPAADVAPEKTDKFRGSKELREAYELKSKTLAQRESELESLNKRLKELEAKPWDTSKQEQAIAEAIAAKEKVIADQESRLKALAFEHSEEFKTKFEKPYASATRAAHEDITQLQVAMEDGSSRPGTKADFDSIVRMPHAAAYTKAKEMFGDAAELVLGHRREVLKIMRDSTQAIEEYKATHAEQEKQEMARQTQEREAHSAMFRRVNEDLSTRFEYFRPDESDPVGNAILKKGFEVADTFFHNRTSLTPQEKVILDARIRNQAAAFPRMVHRNKALKSRVAELETKLKEFEDSKPGALKRDSGTPALKNDETNWEKDFDSRNFGG